MVAGREGETSLTFVVGILRNPHGEPYIHRLCKEIMQAIPSDSPLLNEMAIAWVREVLTVDPTATVCTKAVRKIGESMRRGGTR